MSLKYLSHLLGANDKTVLNHMKNVLKRHYEFVYSDNYNYVYAEGENSICLAAHVDTVRQRDSDEPVDIIKTSRNTIQNNNGILGADDRAGCYAISFIIKACEKFNIPKPSVIITNHEESGGIGMNIFLRKNYIRKDSINLIIALDRCGKMQFVYYVPIDDAIKRYMEKFGFKEHNGIFSDVMLLTQETKIPSVNVSIGYHRPHSPLEALRIDHMFKAINAVIEILKNPIDQCYTISEEAIKRELELRKQLREIWLGRIKGLKVSLKQSKKEPDVPLNINEQKQIES